MLYELKIASKCSAKRIEEVEFLSSGKRPEGMFELFVQLENRGHCTSYSLSRIYYLAYLLAEYCPEAELKITSKPDKQRKWKYGDVIKSDG